MMDPAPAFRTLVGRFADGEGGEGEPPLEASLSAVLAGDGDPMRLVGYLAGLGLEIRTVDDLLLVNDLTDEEEVAAFRVAEGVALSVASHGAWVLFRP